MIRQREVRAAAGIMFLFAFMTFASAWFQGNFRPTKIFVIAFLIDFTIRLFVNPRYAPSMIVARFAVRGQAAEWVGAPQKRFAWAIGWLLAIAMLWLIVINNVIGPINMLVCATCLTLISKHRQDGAHMRAAHIFSKNDVIANLGVILAGALVWWQHSPYPDLIIGSVIALIVLRGGLSILRGDDDDD